MTSQLQGKGLLDTSISAKFGKLLKVVSGSEDKLLLERSMFSTLSRPVNASGSMFESSLLSNSKFCRFLISLNVSRGISFKLLLERSRVRKDDRIFRLSRLTSPMLLFWR